MKELIDKAAVIAEIKRIMDAENENINSFEQHRNTSEKQRYNTRMSLLGHILSFLNTIEVIDPYEECVQYASIKAGIQAHAETYSFNIESELFNQLSKEQQELWRKEIEQACISGGEVGVELAKDPRYKENVEVKEVDLEKEYEEYVVNDPIFGSFITNDTMGMELAKYFFELGLKTKKGE